MGHSVDSALLCRELSTCKCIVLLVVRQDTADVARSVLDGPSFFEVCDPNAETWRDFKEYAGGIIELSYCMIL